MIVFVLIDKWISSGVIFEVFCLFLDSCWWVVFVGWIMSDLELLILVKWENNWIELINLVVVFFFFFILKVKIVFCFLGKYFCVKE